MTRPNILIVDDEPSNLNTLRAILGQDYHLAMATSGEQALAAVERVKPELILLDVQMPGMSGIEVCYQLKRNPATRNIPVIFVTSLSQDWDEAVGFKAGAVDYISKPISALTVKARVKTHLSLVKSEQLVQSHRDAISMLGEAGHYKDNDTGVHIWRMAAYAKVLARALDWSEQQAELLELAAPMHDTGKIGIPEKILCKPGKLDADEWQVMQQHARMGYEILSRSQAPVFQLAAEIALNHHEKWDGSGYPNGLVGEQIPQSARIVAIADVFDALTMKRPYKEAWSETKALVFIQSQVGSHFEPLLVAAFEASFDQLLEIKAEWQHKETKPC